MSQRPSTNSRRIKKQQPSHLTSTRASSSLQAEQEDRTNLTTATEQQPRRRRPTRRGSSSSQPAEAPSQPSSRRRSKKLTGEETRKGTEKKAQKKRKVDQLSGKSEEESKLNKVMKRDSEASKGTSAEDSSMRLETPTDMDATTATPAARRDDSRMDLGALGAFLRQVGSHRNDEGSKDEEEEDEMFSPREGGAASSSSSFPEGLAFLMSAASGGSGFMQRIITELKSDDSLRVIAALTELNDVLNLSGEEIALGFPVESAVPLLVRHIERDDPQDGGDDPDTRRLLASRCLYSLLDILPSATARALSNSENGLAVICDKLTNITNIDLAEQCIRVLFRVSSEQPTSLFCAGGVQALLECMDFFTTYCQSQAMGAVKNMVSSARVTPDKWEEYLVEPQCCLNQLANVLDHADSGMQARAADTWKGMLNNMMRVYANCAASPTSSPPSSARVPPPPTTTSTMGRILNRFRSNSKVNNGQEEIRSNTGEESAKVSSRVVGVAMEKLVGEDGERLRKIVERAEQELDHPSSSSTSNGVVTDLLACMASVATCSDKLAAMMMEDDTTGRLLGKLLGNGSVGEELGRQALRTATALLPAVKFVPPKSGDKKIDVNKIMRLSGEQASSDASSGSGSSSVRSVPRELLVKLMTGAVASTAAEPQNSMQLLLAGSMYGRHRGWNLAASQPELVDGIVSSVADILGQQCSAPRYSPSLIMACIHTILCITPRGKSTVMAVQELVYRHGLIRSLKDIQGWKDDSEASTAGPEEGSRCNSDQQKPGLSRSSSLLGGLRRSSRSSLSSNADEEAAAGAVVEAELQPVGWLPLLNVIRAEANQALRILDRGKDAGGLASKLALSRSGEMNLNAFTKLAESPTPPTPYELLQSGMLEKMCDFAASGQEADGIRIVLAENPVFYEHLVKCLVSAIDRHQLLTLALDPGAKGGLPTALNLTSQQRGSLGTLGMQLLGKPIRLKLERRKDDAKEEEVEGTPQNRTSSSSSSATPRDGMSRRLRRMLSTPSRWNSDSPSKRSTGESTVESLLPANLLVTVEPLATMGAVGGYVLQRVKFFRGCLSGGSRAFMEELLVGEDEDEEAFLMGLHGDEDDDIDDDEDGFDDDIILDEDEEDRHLAMFGGGRRKRSQDDDEDDTLGSSSSRTDEEAIKRMMAEACGGGRRGRSARRRAALEDDDKEMMEDDGHKEREEQLSPRRKNRDENGAEKSKGESGTPAAKPQEPTGVVISLDGSIIPNNLTVVQAVWLAAMRKRSESESGKSSTGADADVGSRAVSVRASMLRNAKPPPGKSSRFVIAIDSTSERNKAEDSNAAESGVAARVGVSGVISSIWGTTHELEFKLTFATDDDKTEATSVVRVEPPHEPKVAVCGRPVAFKERVKGAAEGVEEHFAQIEGQNWDGLDRLVELLVSLSKLRPKDSPVSWASFACPTLSKRQLSASSSPLGLITSMPDELKVLDGKADKAAACSKLVSVAPVLFDTEARRRVMASSCFGLHRALQSINDSNVANEGPSSPTSQQQLTALPRQKVRIRRDKLLESAVLVMNVFGTGTEKTSAALEIEFMGEVGTGSGPTNEFYACVAEELKQVPGFSREAESRLFPVPKAEEDGCNAEAYSEVLAAAEEQRKNPPKTTTETNDHSPVHRARSNSALSDVSEAAGDITANVSLPSPMPSPKSKEEGAKEASSVGKGATVESSSKRKDLSVLEAWRLAGHVVARCILDNRLVDLDIHPVMWELVKEILATEDASKVYFLSLLDPTLHRTLVSLKNMSSKELQVLDIDATKVPGYEDIAVPGLKGTVNNKNVAKFVDGVATAVTYTGVYWQLRAFADAFAEILSPSALSLWRSEDELTELTYGSSASRPEYWTKDHLLSAIQPKHGYTSNSPAVQYLVDVMANDLSPEQRQQLVRFLTGSPTLPIGGFAALKPQLTVVRQVLDNENANPDDFLPSVMTCASFMKLPDYSSKDALKRQLLKAISEGQKAFLMS